MEQREGYLVKDEDVLQPAADMLFDYLRDVIYDPANAKLDVESLPAQLHDFGEGLRFFSGIVLEMTALAQELASGNLNCKLPPPSNEIAAPLKMLHASLKHLTWQAQQVANGDYQQHVEFMGDFSAAFNNMTRQLEERRITNLAEKSRLELYVNLMLANYQDPILLFDLQGNLAYASDSYLRRCGAAHAEQIQNTPLAQLFAPVVSTEFLQTLKDLFAVAQTENRMVETAQDVDFGQTGASRRYQIQLTPMLDAEGNNQGVMLFMHDTTEIERARELAEQSSRAKSDFLARMSHEMRTPMNAIIGMTAVCGATDDPERKDYCLEKISEASRHLLGVINDMLDMSKIEAEEFALSPARFDFRKMVERVTGSMTFKIEERRHEFSLSIDPQIPKELVADEQRLAQVIANLLSNAVKFAPKGGKISLSAQMASADGDSCRIRVTVKDNGAGVSPEQQKRIFVPFEQADGGLSRKFGGTGLGLPICKRIVEMMGGDIWVESQPGQGAAFIFEITAGKAEVAAKEQSEQGETDNIFAGRRALLAEDVEINREILSALLEHTGLVVDAANDGVEALEKFAATPEAYDLILMDIHMPNMDGYEATKRIRRSNLPGADTIPIIAMTANVFREDIERCLACGMNSHLGKPIVAEEVIARLKEYLR